MEGVKYGIDPDLGIGSSTDTCGLLSTLKKGENEADTETASVRECSDFSEAHISTPLRQASTRYISFSRSSKGAPHVPAHVPAQVPVQAPRQLLTLRKQPTSMARSPSTHCKGIEGFLLTTLDTFLLRTAAYTRTGSEYPFATIGVNSLY